MPKAVTKGYIKNVANGSIMQFQYNPTGFTDRHAVNYGEMSGVSSSYPSSQFISGKSKTFEIKLFMYDWAGVKIKKDVAFLNSFLPPGFEHTYAKAPPALIFAFGWYVKKCRLDDLSVDYKQFNERLDPQYAVVTLKLTILGGNKK